jgi:hypothetical protein
MPRYQPAREMLWIASELQGVSGSQIVERPPMLCRGGTGPEGLIISSCALREIGHNGDPQDAEDTCSDPVQKIIAQVYRHPQI